MSQGYSREEENKPRRNVKEKSTNAKGSSNHISALPSQSRFGHALDADADVGAALYFSLMAITAMSAFRDVIARKLLLNSTLEKLSSSKAEQGRAGQGQQADLKRGQCR